jgi:hypothetical protein
MAMMLMSMTDDTTGEDAMTLEKNAAKTIQTQKKQISKSLINSNSEIVIIRKSEPDLENLLG